MYSVPIYLYTGPEFGERNDAVAEAKRAAEKKFGSIDYHQLYTSDVSLNDVLSLLRNGNLFVPARFVVLRGAEAIKKKEDIQLLSEWCEEQKSVKSDDGKHNVLVPTVVVGNVILPLRRVLLPQMLAPSVQMQSTTRVQLALMQRLLQCKRPVVSLNQMGKISQMQFHWIKLLMSFQ